MKDIQEELQERINTGIDVSYENVILKEDPCFKRAMEEKDKASIRRLNNSEEQVGASIASLALIGAE